MELTLDQALQKGIEAHKAGQVQEADRYYTAILKANPKHPDANHNMGVLAVGVTKIEEALPFFKTAIEVNPKVAQYWLSYIDALIKLDRMDDAKAVLEQAKSNGVNGKVFDKLQEKITPSTSIIATPSKTSGMSLKEQIKIFYTTIGTEVLKGASTGWLYYLRYDQNFLAMDNIEINLQAQINTNNKKSFSYKELNQHSALKQNNIVDKINEIDDLRDKFHTLESLNTSENKLLFSDSFFESSDSQLKDIQKSMFKRNQLNVVIIGAGPCGLYLSNALKYKFKNKINVLVLDNHCDLKHFKKPFSRRWLTHLSLSYFDKYFDPETRKLARSFGKDGYVGLPINLLEILLLISSKRNSVKFYFDQKFDYSVFDSSLIDLVFDASGGRVPKTRQKNTSDQEIEIQIPNRSMKVSSAGIKNLPIQNVNSDGNFSVTLKEDGFYHYPHFNGTPLFLRMIKLTQVPTSLYPNLMEFVQRVSNNRFYIWKGTLSDNINEILVIINLTLHEYNYLKSMIHDMQRLSMDLVEKAFENEKIGSDLIDFLKVCAANQDDQIYMNAPFISKPWVNLKPLNQSLNGIEVYPVGDTLFQGNPKVGNGLGTHLQHIMKLVEEIIWR